MKSNYYLKSLAFYFRLVWAENPRVGGSIPSLGTSYKNGYLSIKDSARFLFAGGRMAKTGLSAAPDEVSPRVRGAFLAFAEGTDNFDKARNETGQA